MVFLPGKYDNVYALQGYKVRRMQVVVCCFCDYSFYWLFHNMYNHIGGQTFQSEVSVGPAMWSYSQM